MDTHTDSNMQWKLQNKARGDQQRESLRFRKATPLWS